MRCTEADAFLHAYVDGELDGLDRDSYEQHLVECDRCSHCSRLQARFKAAIRGHLPRPEVPNRLKRRIEAAIASAPPPAGRWRWQLYPKLVPAVLAAAAIVVLVFTNKGRPSLAVETALRAYSTPLPMDFVGSSCATVSDWFHGRVDFPVRAPSESMGARCEGGRIITLRDRMGALVMLRTPSGHRLALMVWEGGDDDDDAIAEPQYRLPNGVPVHEARARGASSLSFRNSDGLFYAVTGDVDQDRLMDFVNVAFRQ